MQKHHLSSLISKAFVGACVCVGSALADPPVAPVIKYHGYINGNLGIIIDNQSGHRIEYQMRNKGSDDSAWVTIGNVGTYANMPWNNYNGFAWTLTTNFTGTAELRARHILNGEYSDWTDIGDVTATIRAEGTTIGLAQSKEALEFAFDGQLHTMIDASGDTADTAWVGKKFDHPTRIKAIRYMPRPDICRSRYEGSIFEVAIDETFSDTKTVHTCPTPFTEAMTHYVQEVVFETPITCGAIRHNKGKLEQTLELEFISADPPWEPNLSLSFIDLTNFYTVATWTLDSRLGATKSRLLRSLNNNGPYAPVSDWFEASVTPEITIKDQYVSASYYYKVECDCHSEFFPDATYVTNYSPVISTRMRRIERSWDDETKLLSGISIMPFTNGLYKAVGSDSPCSSAFDGDRTTHSDAYSAEAIDGPVGLNFGQNVWVGGVGYVCRNNNSCYARIHNAALFCASGDDTELHDRVQCSEYMKKSSQDTTLYYQDATYTPAAGAKCWFFYNNHNAPENHAEGKFCCDVAELMFFGWTQEDIDATPIVTAPSDIQFTHTSQGLILTWKGGNNANKFIIERRPRSEESEWFTVIDDLTEKTYHDTNLYTSYFEYRITAEGEWGSATSEIVQYPYYEASDGTGLHKAMWLPYTSKGGLANQITNVIDCGVSDLNLDLSIDGLKDTAWMVWTGTIDCPFTGDYTFTLVTDGGATVWLDEVDVCNDWTGNSTSITGKKTLTAGTHTIRVDYHMADGVTDKAKCILYWGGVVADEIIPVSQLKPSESAPSPLFDNTWQMQSYGCSTLGYVKKTDNGYYIVGSSKDVTSRENNELMYIGQPVSGNFEFSAHFDMINHGLGYLMVRNQAGDFLTVYVKTRGQAYTEAGTRKLLAGSDAIITNEIEVNPDNSRYFSDLRILRRGSKFMLYQRMYSTSEWNLLETFEDTEHIFNRNLTIGFATGAYSGSLSTKGTYKISDIYLKEYRGVAIFIR